MIFCKLAEIMMQRQIKIADLIRDTGITRPTLASLYNNKGKGINFETLDKLCSYLSVTPGDLFAYYEGAFNTKLALIPANKFGFISNASKQDVVTSGFFGVVTLSERYDPVWFIGCAKPGNEDDVFDVELNIYTPPGEPQLLASLVMKDLMLESLESVMKKTINHNFKFGKRATRFKNPGHLPKDFSNAKITKVMQKTMYDEKDD